MESPEEVCRKSGLTKAEYLTALGALTSDLRSLPKRSADWMLRQDFAEELSTLEQLTRAGRQFGALRILGLITEMSRVTKEAVEQPKGTAHR
jgi:hypothetical protein